MSASSSYASSSSSDDDENHHPHDRTGTTTTPPEEEPPTKRGKLNHPSPPQNVVPVPMPPTEDRNTTTTTGVGPSSSTKHKPIIIILDQASLETVKNKRTGIYELLNCDDHRDVLGKGRYPKKTKKNQHKEYKEYRPDILHQELLALTDSPLAKAGYIKIYIRTQTNVLIDVHPACRIPRTYKRFAGLMVQLLHKLKIKAATTTTNNKDESNSSSSGNNIVYLLRVIKNPISQYLPAGTQCYGLETDGTLYTPQALAQHTVPPNPPNENLYSSSSTIPPPTCFIVGAMATGNIQRKDHPYLQEMVRISEYPLSGAAALARLAAGIEHYWGIV
jgi:rRNA small subunit pseudouridine methyltransferase Nep1